MISFYAKRSVWIFGGSGFIGRHLTDELLLQDAHVTIVDNNKRNDILKKESGYSAVTFLSYKLKEFPIDKNAIVFVLSGRVANVSFNKTHPGTMFRDNLIPVLNILEQCRIKDVDRVLLMSSAAVYSSTVKNPTSEIESEQGNPDEAHSGYGWAKRMIEKVGAWYAQEYSMNIAIARPTNIYGPRDYFSKEGHVIPSIITRIFSGENPLSIWGSGKQQRSFLHVTDLILGLLKHLEVYPKPEPLNYGSSQEITIKELAEMIVNASGKEVKLKFDLTKPEGQLRRCLDNTKAIKAFSFSETISLKEGIASTISWYKKQIAE